MEIKRASIKELSYERFISEHWKPGIPLVFTDASSVWQANGTFSPDWFRKNYGDRHTEVNGKDYTMAEILDLVEGKDTSRPVPYPCKFHVNTQLPEVMPMLSPLSLNYAKPNWLESSWFSKGQWGGAIELFIGGPGGTIIIDAAAPAAFTSLAGGGAALMFRPEVVGAAHVFKA